MKSRILLLLLLGCLLAAAVPDDPTSQPTTRPTTTQKAKEELKLEDLYPEKSLFGPSARSTAFSHDGKSAAYLYRPYKERRHGSDLWILDSATGKTRRVTSVSVMAEFQADTRKVEEDRIKKAKKAEKAEKKGAEKDVGKVISSFLAKFSKKTGKKSKLGDRVDDKDADDEKAPRYGGISAFRWSPVADEMLFDSGGDIYRLFVGEGKIVRLTSTKERERDVQYLPDGSGYTYMRGSALLKVTFESHLVVQLDPKLPSGQSMSGYRLSPDGKRMVFLATKSGKAPKPQRKVKIARYRDRFMDVREVPRTVSDDPLTPAERSVYLHEFNDPMTEGGKLWKVHTHKVSGPRDILRVPKWSPDSNRVTFAVFEQRSRHVEILEADFPPEKDDDKKDAEKKDKDDTEKKADSEKGDKENGKNDDDKKDDDEKKDRGRNTGQDEKKDGDAKERKARVVYRFLHSGGPNTPSMMQPRYLADSRRIVFLSEHTGFRQLHLLDPLYEATEALTHGRYEVYPIDMTKDRKWMFVTATKEHPARRDVYRIDMDDAAVTRLSKRDGVYSTVAVSPDGTKVLANYATFGKLRELYFIDAESPKPKRLTKSHPKKAGKHTKTIPEFFTYKNRHGHDIHGFMFKPDDWTPADKRPLLIYVYGGPLGTRKMVVDGSYSSDAYFFNYYLAKKHGYVACTIDPRGTSGYGGLFEKSNFEQVGKPQVEDLVDGAAWFVENHGVDEKRIAIHGWSFGGFQTQMCLYTEPDVFACGIAGAGPTEWENYNSWYSTGTIGDSREGQTDLKRFSLLPLAKNLKSKLLLVHGMEDANVLYQDTVRVYRELLKAGKETLVELFLDTTGGHGLGGDVKRIGRMRKYEEFLLRNIGTGEAAQPTTQPATQPTTQPTTRPTRKSYAWPP